MTIKQGTVVSHTGASAWGVGKVLEVAALKATIQFSDGVVRKIASSHYGTLQPGDPTLFVPMVDSIPALKAPAAPRKPRKAKQAVAIDPA